MTKPGRIPANTQSATKNSIAANEAWSVSWAVPTVADRARPRKVTPNALTKQAAAKAAARASIAPIAGTRSFNPHCGRSGLSRIAWKINHSEAKPFSGGSAEIANEPARNAKAVIGITG